MNSSRLGLRRAWRSLVLSLLLTLASLGLAERLAVYPFQGQDLLLGVAVADRVAAAFAEQGEWYVYGPDVAPSLGAPLVTDEGYASLVGLLTREDGRSTDTPEGAALLRAVLGADAVLAGRVLLQGDLLLAEMYLAEVEGVDVLRVTAPEGDPSLLARKAALLVAHRLGLTLPVLDYAIDLSSTDGEVARAVALAGSGFLEEALQVLAPLGDRAGARGAALREDLQAVRLGETTPRSVRLAALSVNLTPFDAALSLEYFRAIDPAESLPVFGVWEATLQASLDDEDAAQAAFDAAATYPYGEAARAAYQVARDLADAPTAFADALETNDLAALLSAALIANFEGDLALEKAALRGVTAVAPSYTYPFERLSFIAFEENEPLAAAQALAVAVRQQPGSDLYWTNLGWAYYLLDLFEASEQASLRAVALEPNQYIAYYNLGLVRAVFGRLAEATDAYSRALALDPAVDDEAVADLEAARERYPNQGAVHYALGTLYDQKGQREAAASAFERYLELGPSAPYDRTARARIEALRAPLPPLEISPGASVGLGRTLLSASPYHPGDRVFLSFELYTAGAELPSRVDLSATLLSAAGEAIAEQTLAVDIPRNAVGYVVDDIAFTLPRDLAAGSYSLLVEAAGSEERRAETAIPLEVTGDPTLLRQLLARNILMLALDAGVPLYSGRDLGRPDAELLGLLEAELRRTAEAAEAALPVIEGGRFAGRSGGELFTESQAGDLRDFLEYLLSGGAQDASFTFVDAYAQWALDGAPDPDLP